MLLEQTMLSLPTQVSGSSIYQFTIDTANHTKSTTYLSLYENDCCSNFCFYCIEGFTTKICRVAAEVKFPVDFFWTKKNKWSGSYVSHWFFLSIQIWRSWSFHVKCCVIHHERYWKSFLAGKYLLLSCIDNRLPSCQATMYFQIFFRQEWNVANDTRGFRVESTIYAYVIYFVGTFLNLSPQKNIQ